MTNVLIVGAGPVGLTMAVELARFGIALRIVDRASAATQDSRALVVWSRTLELLERAGCSTQILKSGTAIHGVLFKEGPAVVGRARFESIESEYNYALTIPQRETESILTAHLRSRGVTIERGTELVDMTNEGESVVTHLRDADGRVEKLITPWLIGCDGAHSSVRLKSALSFDGEARAETWLLADVRISGTTMPPPDQILTYFHGDGPLAIFPLPHGRVRVIASSMPIARPRESGTWVLKALQSIVDTRSSDGFQLTDPIWQSSFRVNERQAVAYRRGYVFLAGDAAHVHGPAGGQGMNAGMQDAFNLAWKLAMVIRGCARPALLDTYQSERHAVGAQVLRNTALLMNLGTLSNPLFRLIRDQALRSLLRLPKFHARVAGILAGTHVEYRSSALSRGRQGGTRQAPKDYLGSPPGSDSFPKFVLYATDRRRGEAICLRYPQLLEAQPRMPVKPWELRIVRPDGYIGLNTQHHDWKGAQRYLASLSP